MKKRFLLLLLMSVFLTGCVNTDNTSFKVSEEEIKKESWNLEEIFESSEDYINACNDFQDNILTNLSRLISKDINETNIKEILETINEASIKLNKIYLYAILSDSLDYFGEEAASYYNLYNDTETSFDSITNDFKNKILEKDDTFWNKILNDESIKPYKRYLENVKESKDHIISNDKKEIISSIENAVNDITDTYLAASDMDQKGELIKSPNGKKIETTYYNRSSSLSSSNRKFRKNFEEAYFRSIKNYINTYASNLTTYIKLSEKLAKFKNYNSVFEEVLIKDGINETIYNNLINGALNNIDIVEDQNKIIKKSLNYDKLYTYDYFVSPVKIINNTYSYTEAKNLIKNSLSVLSSEYTNVLNKAFTENWIDVYKKENKEPSALCNFSYTHPYILVNYDGTLDETLSLTYELGHAINNYLSNDNQEGFFNSMQQDITSEVSSTTNEILLIHYLIKNAKTDDEKLSYLFRELNLINTTYFNQVMFSSFETKLHNSVIKGDALSADFICKCYNDEKTKFSPGISYTEGQEYFWANIPHFYYDFYVYKYALSIAGAYNIVDGIENNDKDAVDNYLSFLKAGSSMNTTECYKLLGYDLEDTNFSNGIINRAREIIKEINEIIDKKK